MNEPAILFGRGALRARELDQDDLPALLRFFVDNPAYFVAVNGAPPDRDEARREFDDLPPPGMPFEKRWMLRFTDQERGLIGMASVLSDFVARRVWRIGLFLVATALHGTGAARALHEQLERGMKDNGAEWIRLGVVQGNQRAERFWGGTRIQAGANAGWRANRCAGAHDSSARQAAGRGNAGSVSATC